MATVAFAAGAGSVSVGSKTANPGDEVTLNVTVSGEFANYEIIFNVDAGLTITGFSGVTGNPANGKVAFAKDENVGSHSFSITIKVAEDLAPGKYYVNPNVLFVSDRDLVDLSVSASAGYIEIKAPEHVHEWSSWKQTKAPDCVTKGEETRTCATCGEVETRAISALGHNWQDAKWMQSKTHHWHACSRCDAVCEHHGEHVGTWQTVKAPTATKEGLKKLICNVCEYEMDSKVIPANPDLPDEPTPGKFDFAMINGALAGMMVLSAAAFVVLKRKAVK
jgi:hypothetical protein